MNLDTIEALQGEIADLKARLQLIEKQNKSIEETLNTIFKLVIPSAAGTHKLLLETAAIIKLSGRDASTYDTLSTSIREAFNMLSKLVPNK